MKTKNELIEDVKSARNLLMLAENDLANFEALAENNVFENLDKAVSEIEDKLMNEAFLDCEGADNCGAPEYTQEFIVAGIKYLGTLKVEYNRHDKTYYYIDEHDFTYTAV